MFVRKSFLLLIYFGICSDTRDLQVLDSGIMRLKKDDMVLMFFLTVKHNGKVPRRAMVTMIECCERITEDDTDCDLMDLYGGDFGVVDPGTVTNFTLLYPNLYGYNRKGTCVVNLLHRRLAGSDSEEIHHRIDFDTSVSTEGVPPVLKGWYEPNSLIDCESPDLDPFDHCNPVNCQLKYSGNRNYFSRKWKLCQRVPTCNADPNKDLPDVVYIPNSNTCRNLENSITKEDIDYLVNKKPDTKANPQKMVNIRCHHGEINPKTGLCVCDYGWKSEVFDPDSYNGQAVYSMCNIQCVRDDPYKLLPPMLGVVLALWLFFCVICCEKLHCFCPGKKSSDSEDGGAYTPLCGKGPPSECTAMMASVTTASPASYGGFKGSDLNLPLPYGVSKTSNKALLISKSRRTFSGSRFSLFSAKKS